MVSEGLVSEESTTAAVLSLAEGDALLSTAVSVTVESLSLSAVLSSAAAVTSPEEGAAAIGFELLSSTAVLLAVAALSLGVWSMTRMSISFKGVQ